jgi:hypothetical protein
METDKFLRFILKPSGPCLVAITFSCSIMIFSPNIVNADILGLILRPIVKATIKNKEIKKEAARVAKPAKNDAAKQKTVSTVPPLAKSSTQKSKKNLSKTIDNSETGKINGRGINNPAKNNKNKTGKLLDSDIVLPAAANHGLRGVARTHENKREEKVVK